MDYLIKKTANIWEHVWATGWQELTFGSDAGAVKWAIANNCEYVDRTKRKHA